MHIFTAFTPVWVVSAIILVILIMLRATQTHLAGHMRPAGRVFETPALHNLLPTEHMIQQRNVYSSLLFTSNVKHLHLIMITTHKVKKTFCL
jgi:hypothetical protein